MKHIKQGIAVLAALVSIHPMTAIADFKIRDAECEQTIQQTKVYLQSMNQRLEQAYAEDDVSERRYRQMKQQLKRTRAELTADACQQAMSKQDFIVYKCLGREGGDVSKCATRAGRKAMGLSDS